MAFGDDYVLFWQIMDFEVKEVKCKELVALPSCTEISLDLTRHWVLLKF